MKKYILASLIALGIAVVGCNNGAMPVDPTPTPTPTVSPSPSPSPDPSPSPTPSFCEVNVTNFSSLANVSLIGTSTGNIWGPNLATLPFPSNLQTCQASQEWNQTRTLAAANYWVGEKTNYCHHHVPTWSPSSGDTPSIKDSYGMCSTNTSIMPPIPTESMIRWNYSGTGNESAGAWYTYDAGLGYAIGNYGNGLDCSDYTKLVYSYAESIVFTSAVALQAGQSASEYNLAPNMSGFTDTPESDVLGLTSAGNLVCADGTIAPNRGVANSASCNDHGGYISVFNSSGQYVESAITDQVLTNLKPGDLLYIAGCASDPDSSTSAACGNNPRTQVTHVVIWTGQQIGSGSVISAAQIAPQTDSDVYGSHHGQCTSDSWMASNNIGNWIITDSHYQGPDYRAFTNCFYRNQVWGVRRVLN